MTSKPIVYIIRGASGSGKSTLAANLSLALNAEICENDQYFYKNTQNVYLFDPSQISKAIHECVTKFKKALAEGKNVIVSNTFTDSAHMREYYNICKEYDITPNVVVCLNKFEDIHDVPPQIKINQRNKLLRTLTYELSQP